MKLVGVDPAPKKDATIWTDTGLARVAALEMPAFVRALVEEHAEIVVAWDAPLSFDPSISMSDRAVDRVVRRWSKRLQAEGRIEAKAVSVLTFSGCPHWAITCATLGVPFGTPPTGLRVGASVADGPKLAVEVHPAVAMAMRWQDLQLDRPFPKYKRAPSACAEIAAAMCFPEAAGHDDDALDAYAGYWLAGALVGGEARLLGDRVAGGYLVPVGPTCDALLADLRSA